MFFQDQDTPDVNMNNMNIQNGYLLFWDTNKH